MGFIKASFCFNGYLILYSAMFHTGYGTRYGNEEFDLILSATEKAVLNALESMSRK